MPFILGFRGEEQRAGSLTSSPTAPLPPNSHLSSRLNKKGWYAGGTLTLLFCFSCLSGSGKSEREARWAAGSGCVHTPLVVNLAGTAHCRLLSNNLFSLIEPIW